MIEDKRSVKLKKNKMKQTYIFSIKVYARSLVMYICKLTIHYNNIKYTIYLI
jgi:hypothetical protein